MPIDYRDMQQILAQLADQITTAMIQDASVSTAKIQDDAITTAKILDAVVDGNKLAATLSGAHTFSGTITFGSAIEMGGNGISDLDEILSDSAQSFTIQSRAVNNIMHLICLRNAANAGNGILLTTLDSSDVQISRVIIPSGTDEVDMTFTDCNLIPAANKDNSLGITGTRWLDIFSGNAVTSGTSRIVRSTAVCPRCNVNAVRSTGGVLALGDSYDYMMAHCPECGMVVAEKFSHSPDIPIPLPKSIVLTNILVAAQSGNTRSVRMEFMYNGKDKNVGYLDEYEIEEFVAGDKSVRMALIMKVAMQEWEADTRTKTMEWFVKQENEKFRQYAAPFVKKNLLAG